MLWPGTCTSWIGSPGCTGWMRITSTCRVNSWLPVRPPPVFGITLYLKILKVAELRANCFNSFYRWVSCKFPIMFHQSVHGIQNKVYPHQITEDAVYLNRADNSRTSIRNPYGTNILDILIQISCEDFRISWTVQQYSLLVENVKIWTSSKVTRNGQSSLPFCLLLSEQVLQIHQFTAHAKLQHQIHLQDALQIPSGYPKQTVELTSPQPRELYHPFQTTTSIIRFSWCLEFTSSNSTSLDQHHWPSSDRPQPQMHKRATQWQCIGQPPTPTADSQTMHSPPFSP